MLYFSIDAETTRIKPKNQEGLLMFSMVAEESVAVIKGEAPAVEELPHFTCFIDHGDYVPGPVSTFAMAMNAWVLLAIDFGKRVRKWEASQEGPASEEERKKFIESSKPSWIKGARGANIPEDTIERAVSAAEKYRVLTMDEFVKGALEFINHHAGPKSNITVAGKNAAIFDFWFLPEALQERIRHRIVDPATLYADWSSDKELPNSEKVKERAGVGSTKVSHDTLEDSWDVIRALRPIYKIKIWELKESREPANG